MDLEKKGKPRKKNLKKSHAQDCSKGHFIGMAFLPMSKNWETSQGEALRWRQASLGTQKQIHEIW